MRSYLDICRSEVSHSGKELGPVPNEEKFFRAYKGGECRTFKTKKEAYAFSNLVDEEITNQEEIEKVRAEYYALDRKCQDIWHRELREEYQYLSDAIFQVCYNRAYDRSHAYGFDEIANTMITTVEFAEEIMAIVEKN